MKKLLKYILFLFKTINFISDYQTQFEKFLTQVEI
jgi:hypothetical protein